MARRLKSTPFARFLLAMIFIVPLAYFIAAYYNGEDPIGMIKEKLGTEQVVQQGSDDEVDDMATAPYSLQEEIERLKERIEQLEAENAELRDKVRRLEMNR